MAGSAGKQVEEYFNYTVKALMLAVGFETGFIRLFSKIGGGIGWGQASSLYDAFTTLGYVVFNLSLMLALTSLGLAGYLLFKGSSNLDAVSSTATFSIVGLAVISFYTPLDAAFTVTYSLLALAAIAVVALKFALSGGTLVKIFSALLIGSYVGIFYFRSAQALSQIILSFEPRYLVESLNTVEALAVVNILPIYLLFREGGRENERWRTVRLAASSIPAGLFTASYLLDPRLTTFFFSWVFGFTLYLPFPLYAAAIWLYTDTVIRLLRAREKASYGLLLILFAGRDLQLTYLAPLAILGVLMLTNSIKGQTA